MLRTVLRRDGYLARQGLCSWAEYYFNQCRDSPKYNHYPSRFEMISDQSNMSVKLQYLAGLLHYICVTLKERVLIFCDWPGTLWNCEMYWHDPEFVNRTVRSKHDAPNREETVRLPKDLYSGVDILECSLRTTAFSVNLQWACSKMIFLTTRPT